MENQTFLKINHNGIEKTIPLSIDYIRTYLVSICAVINDKNIDVETILNNVYQKLKTINTIDDINEQIISTTSEMASDHHAYPKIATYILIRKLHKNTHSNYEDVIKDLLYNVDSDDILRPIISEDFANFVFVHSEKINSELKYEKDYNISLFGYRTLEKSYLKKNTKDKIIERQQHVIMRVSIAIHRQSIYKNINAVLEKIFESYNLMSEGYFTHATPTLFNAGTNNEQLASCFLMGIEDDMGKVGDCFKDCLITSKYGGGIGICVTPLRSMKSKINSTQGYASGMSIAGIYNALSRYSHQGGRPGSFALYCELWHADIMYFLDLKKNTGAETDRARDLFLGLTVNDIFMQRVEADGIWSLMCPAKCPNLLNKFGEEFTKIYEDYESRGKFICQIPARDVWFKITESQIETGIPYMLYKNATNVKSNQSNIGVINGSNLCIEIVEVATADEYSVCSLSSICLPKFFNKTKNGPVFDYKKLYEVTRIVTRNLNNIIDVNYYPLEKMSKSNLSHRPIGIGVQGLADLFFLFKIPFDSVIARDLNKKIFETIYFGFLSESADLAVEFGPYSSFWGSPASKGLLQFDLWGVSPSDMWEWQPLKEQIMLTGLRNSLGIAGMPTASTSSICNNVEASEAITSNLYVRATNSGDYYVPNKYLMDDLIALGLWNSDMIDLIKYYEGSIQHIDFIPDEIKQIYRTVWEIEQKSIIEMAADRAPFIDQTQSMNIFMAKNKFYPPDHYLNEPLNARISSSHFLAWKLGLKTGIYYLRTKPASEANQFGIDIDKIKELEKKYKLAEILTVDEIIMCEPEMICELRPSDLDDGETCMMCSS